MLQLMRLNKRIDNSELKVRYMYKIVLFSRFKIHVNLSGFPGGHFRGGEIPSPNLATPPQKKIRQNLFFLKRSSLHLNIPLPPPNSTNFPHRNTKFSRKPCL